LTLLILLAHRNRKTNTCNVLESTLAKEVGCKVRTIQRAIKTLRDKGYITAVQPNKRRCNVYGFTGNIPDYWFEIEGLGTT
jgi:DNA-binding MarR family transcriptional regulator